MTDKRARASYCPTLTLPAYRYVPLLHPHPREHLQGHSFEAQAPQVGENFPKDWQHELAYLYGIDLFNHGYFWECHEAWENLWLPRKADPFFGPFFQGFILFAAALLKQWMGEEKAYHKLAKSALAKLSSAAKIQDKALGIDMHQWILSAENYLKHHPEVKQDPLLAKDFPTIVLRADK